MSTASMASTPPALSPPEEPGQAPRVPLPGELYQRAGRWWWRVQLPGEDKAKARPLKSDGTKVTADDNRQSAESIAFEIWEHAVAENAVRKIQWESAEKIERLKAQFLDKVRHFTELAETANAKIEAEAAARAKAEAKVAQMQVQDGLQDECTALPDIGGRRTDNGGRPADDRGQRTEDGGQKTEDSAVLRPPPSVLREAAPLPSETGVCDCCGATGIAVTCLTRIDSGQSLCPRCRAALQDDIARIAP